MSSAAVRRYTLAEEVANSVTHGIGAVLSVAALVVMVVMAAGTGDARKTVSLAVYGATLLVLYLSSTLYHSLPGPGAKKVFRFLDHAAIYLLIAGTYTPFTLVSLKGGWGWTLFGLIWSMALVGLVMTFLGAGRSSRVLASLVYIGMGWLVVIAVKPLLGAVPAGGLFWLVAGGLAYTSGVIFYVWKNLPFNHALWHLFVLAGSACHFTAVYFYVLPG